MIAGVFVVALAFGVACSKQSPPPPEVTPPSAGETINGTERIGWTQRAADAVELATVRYAIYVDSTRSELAGASCDTTPTANGFACTARLPTLSAGAHTLELASFVVDGSLLESARSAALRVTVVTQIESTVKAGPDPFLSKSAAKGIGPLSLSVDGTRLRVELVADDLDEATDLAFAPDGRLFIAERGGTIRSVRDGRLSEPAPLSDTPVGGDRLLAITVDPDFARTRFLFAIVVRNATFAVTRAREVANTFGERAVLLEGVGAAGSEPAASLRFGPDGKLYAAFDDGGEPQQVGDAASSNGKILRLNADGTTPEDQTGAAPIYALGSRSPAGLDWQAETGMLWIADRTERVITPVVPESRTSGRHLRGVARTPWRLPAASVPSALAFARGTLIPALTGNLLIASTIDRHLLRVRFDPLGPSRVASTEPLLQDLVGPILAVASAPDGAIYFATPRSVGRLVPDSSR